MTEAPAQFFLLGRANPAPLREVLESLQTPADTAEFRECVRGDDAVQFRADVERLMLDGARLGSEQHLLAGRLVRRLVDAPGAPQEWARELCLDEIAWKALVSASTRVSLRPCVATMIVMVQFLHNVVATNKSAAADAMNRIRGDAHGTVEKMLRCTQGESEEKDLKLAWELTAALVGFVYTAFESSGDSSCWSWALFQTCCVGVLGTSVDQDGCLFVQGENESVFWLSQLTRKALGREDLGPWMEEEMASVRVEWMMKWITFVDEALQGPDAKNLCENVSAVAAFCRLMKSAGGENQQRADILHAVVLLVGTWAMVIGEHQEWDLGHRFPVSEVAEEAVNFLQYGHVETQSQDANAAAAVVVVAWDMAPIRTALVRLLAYLSGIDAERIAQGRGVYCLLAECTVDPKNAMKREWCIVGIRLLCEKSERCRALIAELQIQETRSDPVLSDAGFEAFLDPSSGTPKLRRRTGTPPTL
ncbi:hypothetical protein FVE85_3070 [Porphyridium purpureum]|uniref:Ataxin-10 domain-containing protein n=1 Tax=Porphyridium purpureum TaxID=35688 RepID=A0A5J4YTK4_PORPP|nr:hypothetical protein FVE85_3070 [Porphyridium purpureum]|eukprot:POR4241..scf227_4